MWGFLGKLFGSDKAIEKSIEVISNGFDKLIYTDEEKAGDAKAERAEARLMIIDWMKNTQGQNLARRVLAFMIAGTWLFMYLFSAAIDAFHPWVSNHDVSIKLAQSGDQIAARADQMSGAVMIIIGFYFAAPHLGSIIEPAIKRFTKKNESN